MTEVVLDASVVLKWLRPRGERHAARALAIQRAYRTGELRILTPSLLALELLNVAARAWGWRRAALVELVVRIEGFGFEYRQPPLGGVAEWAAEGLTAYDASYVALAESRGIPLVTDDDTVRAAAPEVAQPLARWRPPATS